MGVLSLHNEGPPVEFGSDTKAICQGIVVGEEATSALLKALADCLNALAAMDDTVGNIVSVWAAGPPPSGAPPQGADASALNVGRSYSRSFEALQPTVERINFALNKYRELTAYARSALEAGRGKEFQAALARNSGDDFESLVNRRIELLRKLKVRVMVLAQLKEHGIHLIESFNFPEFFLMFMQPIRDVAVTADQLYSEVVRGALASHATLFQVCRLQGEEAETQPAAAAGAQSAAAWVAGD
jgi:hypothetical protein